MSNRRRAHPSAFQRAQAARAAAERRRRQRHIAARAVFATTATAGILLAVTLSFTYGSTTAVPRSADAAALGCASCHTTDGHRSEGPTWKGLWGSTVTLSDGRTVVADAAYVRRAIEQPQADVVAGYPPMPTQRRIGVAQLARLVAFIRTLRSR